MDADVAGTGAPVDYALLRRQVEEDAEANLALADSTIPRPERKRMAIAIADEVLGLGPLTALLRDPTITEIIVNGFDQVYVEMSRPPSTGRMFLSRRRARVADRRPHLVADWSAGRLRFPDGRRAPAGWFANERDHPAPVGARTRGYHPQVFGAVPAVAEHLVAHHTLSESAVTFLAACVRGRLNILVSGGTGTGKTTLLNILSRLRPGARADHHHRRSSRTANQSP